MLFHVSEEAGIREFEPRALENASKPVVWAIDASRLRNYLLPRDCPRVTFYAGRETTDRDVERFLGSSTAVVAIERVWLERVRFCRLYCYHVPPTTFVCADECAGYYVSPVRVAPAHVEVIDDPISALMTRGVEIRVVANLWPLRDAVAESTLQFLLIRMRNALPRLRST